MSAPSLLDKAKFYAIAGAGFFADGYLNLSISTVLKILGYIYFQDQGGVLSPAQSGAITASVSVGVIIGTILFGFFGDAFGRHSVYGRELILTIIGDLMSVLLPWKGFSKQSIVAWMAVSRVFVGFGTGGDSPISAALSAEKAGSKGHTTLFLSIFFLNAMGNVAASLMLVILLAGFKEHIQRDNLYFEWVWRLLLGFDVQNSGNPTLKKRTVHDQWRDFTEYFSDWKHARAFIALFIINFLYNFASHGISLNQALVLSKIGFGTGSTTYESMWHTAVGNVIIFCAGYLPGFILSCHILPFFLPRKVQLGVGVLLVVLTYVSWAASEGHIPPGVSLFFVAFSQFLFHAGPVIIAYIPVELFPTRVRATATGIAAIGGSIASILISYAFGTLLDSLGISRVLALSAGLFAIAIPLLFWIPETKGCFVEEIESDIFYKDPQWKKNRDLGNIIEQSTVEDARVESLTAKGASSTSDGQ
ncbi:unnamed protein product [Clonostachys chloroleuca]|uniref:Major facilitator superfamily (MFS) profile domain-containing protein n=1 Tax=Clonostachys chloroleuca TaxID=1926264 RepID=A0AA35M5A2_9HYPO|nr:unnamed protein product [Clonostachys chloroleuca]